MQATKGLNRFISTGVIYPLQPGSSFPPVSKVVENRYAKYVSQSVLKTIPDLPPKPGKLYDELLQSEREGRLIQKGTIQH
jgi:hypothetical protein